MHELCTRGCDNEGFIKITLNLLMHRVPRRDKLILTLLQTMDTGGRNHRHGLAYNHERNLRRSAGFAGAWFAKQCSYPYWSNGLDWHSDAGRCLFSRYACSVFFLENLSPNSTEAVSNFASDAREKIDTGVDTCTLLYLSGSSKSRITYFKSAYCSYIRRCE